MTKKPKPAGPTYPRTVETYSDPRWLLDNRGLAEPTCINGDVRVERYRITIERVEDPREVLRDRIVMLWRSSERNSHTWGPMREAAKRLLGIDDKQARELLDIDDQGADYKEH